ncbi:unnamed protein product [Ceutorhynchus assimilis]|uniref:Purine nucleoside phosphorylase n=1 Tax=Ceutorhynchus assimilis TaxID=467358 RepID=A0A9N9MUQ4_9CUCU|nr:unnamed protein product [Ceutorhynchus assimilis]
MQTGLFEFTTGEIVVICYIIDKNFHICRKFAKMSDSKNEEFSLDYLQKAADYLRNQVPFTPKLLIICGTGLGGLSENLQNQIEFNYKDIPNFPVSNVKGHAGKLIFGTLSEAKIVCMKGRFHYFEGYSLQKIATPIRILKLLGVEGLIVTNAAGSVNEDYKVGDIMIIKDHVNFLAFGGQHPLRGPNEHFFGERFFPMNRAYDRELIRIAKEVAEKMGISDDYHEGVYGLYAGPNYETVAEVRILKMLGVDAAGMSTIPEVLVAKHCGMSVFGFSFITNRCIHCYDEPDEPNHDDVLKAVMEKSETVKKFVANLIQETKQRWK